MTQTTYHNVYKVLRVRKFAELRHSHERQRISASVRAGNFLTVYPVNKWIEIPVGVSFVFVDEQAAFDYRERHTCRHSPLEVWKCEADGPARQMFGIAGCWRDIGAFWQAEALNDLSTLARISVPCPETYYGVRTLKLFTKIG